MNTIRPSLFAAPMPAASSIPPMAPPGSNPTPADRVDLATPAPEVAARPPAGPKLTGTRALGLALALGAATLGASAAGAAQLDVMPAPSIGQDIKTQASLERDAAAIAPKTITEMKDLAAGNVFDNMTARQTRDAYRQKVDSVANHAEAYRSAAAQLVETGHQLDSYLEMGAGVHEVAEGASLTVNQDGGGSSVVLSKDGGTASSVHKDGTWTVEADGQRLVDAAGSRTVTSRGVSRQLHLKGEKAGTFEITRQGFRRQETTTVEGTNIETHKVEVIAGIAGNERIETRERFEDPEVYLTVYPRTELIHTQTSSSDNTLWGMKFDSYRTVEVRQDGSTRVRHNHGGKPVDTIEPAATVPAGG